MKDFNLKVTVRNARLLKAIRKTHESVKAFCRDHDLPYTQVNPLITMREKPMTKDGKWKDLANRIAWAVGIPIEDIWPEHIRENTIKKPSREVEMDLAEVAQIEARGDQHQQRQLLAHWSKSLTDREIKAVEATLDGTTYAELGQELGGVSVERARQIQRKALRKMQKAAWRDGIKSYAEAAE